MRSTRARISSASFEATARLSVEVSPLPTTFGGSEGTDAAESFPLLVVISDLPRHARSPSDSSDRMAERPGQEARST